MDLRDQKILVTGGGGFLGRFVLEALRARGAEERNIRAPRAAEADFRIRENCIRETAGMDLVIHLAAMTGGIEFHKKHPADIFYNNFIMGAELMEAARVNGVRKFVSIGSAAEYPAASPVPYKEGMLWDGFPEEIHGPYSVAKRMLIAQGNAYREQYGFNAVHLMPANMYGPGESVKSGYVIPSLVDRIFEAIRSKAPFIEVWGTGVAAREFLYAGDAAEGILLAAEKYDKPEPVNLGSGEEVKIKDLVHMIAAIMGYAGEIRWDASKPDGQLRRVVDSSLAEAEFGFRAKTGIEEGLRQAVAFHLKEKGVS
jgi:GDP-L-fucose synthase